MSTTTTKISKKNKAKAAKLRTILACPFKEKCPTLSEADLKELQGILLESLSKKDDKSTLAARASDLKIRLGLESTLRAINNDTVSCVLINLSLKPHFLINLIKRNVETKTKALIFAQKNLDNFTRELFKISAAALALPKDISEFSSQLAEWLQKHARTKLPMEKPEKRPYHIPKKAKVNKIEAHDKPEDTKDSTNSNSPLIEPTTGKKSKKKYLGADYVSFACDDDDDEPMSVDEEEAEDHLSNALGRMAKEISKKAASKPNQVIEKDDGNNVEVADAIQPASSDNSSELDDFLSESTTYRPIVVHKININPNKKPKTKRKKKQKKQK